MLHFNSKYKVAVQCPISWNEFNNKPTILVILFT